MNLVCVLGDVRRKQGMSKRELAGRSGISYSAICAYEYQTRTPSIKQVAKLASVLKVNWADLFEAVND